MKILEHYAINSLVMIYRLDNSGMYKNYYYNYLMILSRCSYRVCIVRSLLLLHVQCLAKLCAMGIELLMLS